MADREHFTVAQMGRALRKAQGFLSIAAGELGCTYQTIRNYIDRHITLQQLLVELDEKELDFSESKLLSQIKDGNTTAIIFHLKCKGKKRGYIEKSEVEHSGGIGISVTEFLGQLPPGTAGDIRKLLAEEIVRRKTK